MAGPVTIDEMVGALQHPNVRQWTHGLAQGRSCSGTAAGGSRGRGSRRGPGGHLVARRGFPGCADLAHPASRAHRGGPLRRAQPEPARRSSGALPSSASRLCDRLEAAGLLTRDTGRASRRAVSLRLTADGEDLLEQARRRRRAQIAQVLDVMPPAGRTELADGLAAFQRAAEPAGRTDTDTDVGTDGSQGSGIPFSISSPYPRETGQDWARRSLGGRQNGRAAVSG